MTSLKKSSLHGLSKIVFILSLMFVNPFHGFGADPDFAFPEKVEKTAASDLRAAVKDGDGKGAVNAMIRLGLAKAQVNTDSLPAVLRQVADLTAAETDPAAKALLNALSAKIYTRSTLQTAGPTTAARVSPESATTIASGARASFSTR